MNRRLQPDPQWVITICSARCAEANCHVPIRPSDSALYFHGDGSLYGSRCGHGEQAECEFAAHRIRGEVAAARRERTMRAILLFVAAILLGVLIGAQFNATGGVGNDWVEAVQGPDTF